MVFLQKNSVTNKIIGNMINSEKFIIQLVIGIMLLMSCSTFAQQSPTAPANGNPILPGYFADPTIKKFGDNYYIYATTDGVKLASGEPHRITSYNVCYTKLLR